MRLKIEADGLPATQTVSEAESPPVSPDWLAVVRRSPREGEPALAEQWNSPDWVDLDTSGLDWDDKTRDQ